MTIKILFFAALRDTLGAAEESLVLPPEINDIGQLRAYLARRGAQWSALDAGRNIRAARNQRMADETEPVQAGDEIAFFPPVTGG